MFEAKDEITDKMCQMMVQMSRRLTIGTADILHSCEYVGATRSQHGVALRPQLLEATCLLGDGLPVVKVFAEAGLTDVIELACFRDDKCIALEWSSQAPEAVN